jgi:hypothetical protein
MLRATLVLAFGFFAASAHAQNAAAGKLYYETPVMGLTCADAGCHGPNPLVNTRNIRAGANNAAAILNAVDTRPQMAVYRGRITAQNAADLAAYIGNPAAAVGGALVNASGAMLAFGQTQIGVTNTAPMPATITITNTGTDPLTITGVARGGAQSTEFSAAGSCVGASVTVAAGANCTLSATFTPAAAGTRTATFTLQSNAASNPTITLTGMAGTAATPSLALSQSALTFNAQTVGTTSMARLIGVTNNGSMPVAITATSVAPNTEFLVSGGCVITLAPGSSCSMDVSFMPAAAGARTATLSIVSDAPGSPHTIALSGPGVTTPTGLATLAVSALSFPVTQVAAAAAPQQAILTNTGNAMLPISEVKITGPDAGEFKLGANNTCAPGNLEVDTSCRLEAEFRPTSGGTKTANIEVTHGAGMATVALAGAAPSTAGSPPPGSRAAPTGMSLLRPSNAGAGAVDAFSGLLVLLAALGARCALRRRD